MARHPNYIPQGVIPACLLPFFDDLQHRRGRLSAASERCRRRPGHQRDHHQRACLRGRVVQLRRAEAAYSRSPQDEIGARLPIVNGIYAEGSLEAARLARMAHEGGASALLVFPPGPFTLGQRPEMVLAHFRRVADASDLPIIAFQYPQATQGYPLDTLLRLIDAVPSVRAIKDWTPNLPLHERHIRTLQSLPRPVNVLSTNSAFLFSSLVLGCKGLLSGAGSVIADLQARLFRAIEGNDLAEARRLNDRIHPMAEAFYCRSLRRHAQPHEGGAGAARQAAARGGAPAARQAAASRDRAHPRRPRRSGPARPQRRAQRRVRA